MAKDQASTRPDTQQAEPAGYVDAVLESAFTAGASDLYWLPGAEAYNVRMRVNGVQRDVGSVPNDYGVMCVTRLKVLAKLLTYRSRVAQDGAIHEHPAARGGTIRVSVMPTQHGERATLRLVAADCGPRKLDTLGFPAETVQALRELLSAPQGMILLTGPTGCGKTTTIYALVREMLALEQDGASIITLEDPIEAPLEGISQVRVGSEEGWTYADALRAALRQDVKTLVIGEMRDAEVVRVTLDAALTGHRVIATYHAGDIPAVYARLLHQGFEPFLIAAAVSAVLTQRLVRTPAGDQRIPLVALMQASDEWRSFVASAPGLTELRRRIQDLPAADMAAVARAAVAEGRAAESALLEV